MNHLLYRLIYLKMYNICEQVQNYLNKQFNCTNINTPLGEFTKVETNYHYADGDLISVFVKDKGNRFIITDLAEGMRSLTDHMVSYSLTDNQNEIKDTLLKYYGVTEYEGMFLIKTYEKNDVPKCIINLAQAISKISDISFMFSGKVKSSFKDKVAYFLENQNLIFKRRKKYEGSSGTNRIVDFYIRGKKTNSLVYTLSCFTKKSLKQRADVINSSWFDLHYLKQQESVKFISLIDDENSQWSQQTIKLLDNLSYVVLWSNKNYFKNLLTTPQV